MKKKSLFLSAFVLSLSLVNLGCDLGTYQQRANAPIPPNTVRAGEVGTAPASSNVSDTDNSGSETSE